MIKHCFGHRGAICRPRREKVLGSLLTGFCLFLVGFFSAAEMRAADTLAWSGTSPFAEPADGGNLDTTYSTFDGSTVVIVPRAEANEALDGATRWRNVLFAIRGVLDKTPAFLLPFTSPGSGKMILNGDSVSFANVKMVWSYDGSANDWHPFDTYTRSGTNAATWQVAAQNTAAFTQDVVYVSIDEHYPVGDFYQWLETEVLPHPLVTPTASETYPGSFIIGTQSGATASAACSRDIASMPLFGFIIKDPAEHPTKLVMLVSGQHPYEGENKAALQGALDWILNSSSDAAKSYRAEYVTLVYPFVNPTGELAGLWRGTAANPYQDVNRHWDTTATDPSLYPGIDTVIIHKNAMKADIAALGMGEPYAVFDYHQNFGDEPGHLDYVLHSSASTSTSAPLARQMETSEFVPYYDRLSALASIADIPSDPSSQQTLRGYMVASGVAMPLTFERCTYHTIAEETAFGVATVEALVDPTATTAVDSTTTSSLTTTSTAGTVVIDDEFSGTGNLSQRLPDTTAPAGAMWAVQLGVLVINGSGSAYTNNSARAVINAGIADAKVASTLNLGSDNTGLILRESNGSNYLRFIIASTGWFLQETAAGATTTLAHGSVAYAKGQDHTLAATLSGASIDLAVDGADVGTFNVSFNQAATAYGLLSSGSGVRTWDSFTVAQLDSTGTTSPTTDPTSSSTSTAITTSTAGAVVIDDEFSGTGNLGQRLPDTTAPAGAMWTVQLGVLVINGSGSAYTNISSRAVINAGVADAEVTSTINLGSDGTGLMLRESNASNYLRFMLASTGWTLQETAAGATTTLARGSSAYAKGQDHTLAATLSGASVDLAVDGVDVGTYNVPFNQTATAYGLLSSGSGVRTWDSFTVAQLNH